MAAGGARLLTANAHGDIANWAAPVSIVTDATGLDLRRLVRAGDLSRIDAAFFTMNGYISVLFFAFWAGDIFLL